MTRHPKTSSATAPDYPAPPFAAQYVLLASSESSFTTGNVWGGTGGGTGP
jgi:hypothetical protein